MKNEEYFTKGYLNVDLIAFENGFTPNMAIIYSAIKSWNVNYKKPYKLSAKSMGKKFNLSPNNVRSILKKLRELKIIEYNVNADNSVEIWYFEFNQKGVVEY